MYFQDDCSRCFDLYLNFRERPSWTTKDCYLISSDCWCATLKSVLRLVYATDNTFLEAKIAVTLPSRNHSDERRPGDSIMQIIPQHLKCSRARSALIINSSSWLKLITGVIISSTKIIALANYASVERFILETPRIFI